MALPRWILDPERDGAARLKQALAGAPYTIFTSPSPALSADEASRSPWLYAERLFGERPRMVERQPIRAMAGGRSFASTSLYTPLHTDSQLYDGGPPDAQVMVCACSAERGGESTLLDAWSLVERIEREDPALFDDLFAAPRRIPFVFGDVLGPTLALRGGSLAFTHTPIQPPPDDVARRLDAHLRRQPPLTTAIRTGETMVLDNRRALHGRLPFDDARREFVRLLVWLPGPLARHPAYESRARLVAEQRGAALASQPASIRRLHGQPGAPLPGASARLDLVMAMLRGVPPGVLAARHKIPEPDLYRWRDAALRAALEALE